MVATSGGFDLESVERDAVSGVHRFEYDHGVTHPSMAVVQALSEVMGVEPTAVRPLASSVDTDALDELLAPHGNVDAAVEVAVTHEGYGITVDSHGTVTVASDGRDQSEDAR